MNADIGQEQIFESPDHKSVIKIEKLSDEGQKVSLFSKWNDVAAERLLLDDVTKVLFYSSWSAQSTHLAVNMFYGTKGSFFKIFEICDQGIIDVPLFNVKDEQYDLGDNEIYLIGWSADESYFIFVTNDGEVSRTCKLSLEKGGKRKGVVSLLKSEKMQGSDLEAFVKKTQDELLQGNFSGKGESS